jgi:prolyl oligopeptidase
VLESVTMVNNQFVVLAMTDARSSVGIHNLDGKPVKELRSCDRKCQRFHRPANAKEAFYAFGSYLYPTTVYRYDLQKVRAAFLRNRL